METLNSYIPSIKEVPCQHHSITHQTSVSTPTEKDESLQRGFSMRRIQNWKSPLVAAAIFLALICLPLLGNISFNLVRQTVMKSVALNQRTMDRMRAGAIGDKAHE